MGNICVYAAPDKAKAVALVVPVEQALKNVAVENGIQNQDLVHDRKLRSVVLQNMQTIGRKAGLTGLEIIDAVVLVEEPWTAQNVSFLPLRRFFFFFRP